MRVSVVYSLALHSPAEFCFNIVTGGGATTTSDGVPAVTPQCYTYTDAGYYYKRVRHYSPQNTSNQVAALLGRKGKD